MLAGNEGKLVRRVVSLYKGDKFERDLVSISGVTTCIERIPAPDQRTMRAWVLQLDRYVDVFTPPYYTALAGGSDDDGDELSSVRTVSAQVHEQSLNDERRREEEELDRLSEEGRMRRGQTTAAPAEPLRTEGIRRSFSRVDTGEEARIAPRDEGWQREDSYVRREKIGGRYDDRNSDSYSRVRDDRRTDVANTGRGGEIDSDARLTYESTRRPLPTSPSAATSQQSMPHKPARVMPKSTEDVIKSLGLDGVMFNAGLADGSFLRYVLERRMIFTAWRRGWINRRSRAYVSDSSMYQATMAELQLAHVRVDALRTRDSASPARRMERVEQADVIFDLAENLLADIAETGGMARLENKLLICDTIRPEQVDELSQHGLGRVGVLTPMPDGSYVTPAEMEAILSFVFGREPRYLHMTDWEKLINEAGLRQEMFSLRM